MKNSTSLFLLFMMHVLQNCSPAEDKTHSEANLRTAQPNIVILFADDLGYGDLSCFGHPTIHTRHLDQMAAEGMKLTQFYAGASVCTPSRAALLTGRLPIRRGMCGNRRVLFPDSDKGLPASEITIAEALKEQGYATACIGKWHLGHLPEYLPTAHGFDEYFGIPYSNDMSPAHSEGAARQGWPPTPLIENTERIEEEPDQRLLTQRYTEKAVQFIEENKNQPFFLYLPYTMPHIPIFASAAFEGKSTRGLYGDVIQEIDWSVGEILSALKDNGLDKNTLVVFTSDNGPWLVMNEEGGSAGLLKDGKGTTWEGGMREPTIAWWPGIIPAGEVSQGIGTTMDLYTTALTLAGAEVPTDRIVDGVDLMPLLKGEVEKVRDLVFYYRNRELYAVRKGPWKAHFITQTAYVPDTEHTEHDPPLLFHLENDPSEKYNKAEEHPEVIADIMEEVRKHKENLDAPESQLESRVEVN